MLWFKTSSSVITSVRLEEYDAPGDVMSSQRQSDGRLVVRVLSLTPKYLNRGLIQKFHQDLLGKEVRTRHVMPELVADSLLGKTVGVELSDDGSIISDIWVFEFTEPQRQFATKLEQALLEYEKNPDPNKKKPIGISVGFMVYLDEEDTSNSFVFFREQSFTPKPHCDDCGAVSIVENETVTSDSHKSLVDPSATQGVSTNVFGNSDFTIGVPNGSDGKPMNIRFSKSKSMIDFVENETQSKSGEIMVDNTAIVQEYESKMNAKQHEYEQAVANLQNEFKTKTVEYEDKLRLLNDKNIELELQVEILSTENVRREIAEMEGITDPTQKQERMNELIALSRNDLEPNPLIQLHKSLKTATQLNRVNKRKAVGSEFEGSNNVSVGKRPPTTAGQPRKLSGQELEKMTPDQILELAGF